MNMSGYTASITQSLTGGSADGLYDVGYLVDMTRSGKALFTSTITYFDMPDIGRTAMRAIIDQLAAKMSKAGYVADTTPKPNQLYSWSLLSDQGCILFERLLVRVMDAFTDLGREAIKQHGNDKFKEHPVDALVPPRG
jgi:hypothetical protein